jgi:hypothetical protein
MKWPTIDEMPALAPLPDGYSYERLKRSGIPALIAGIKVWHPDISVGAASCYLREDFYSEKVFLEGEADRDICVLLFKHNDELVGMWSFEQEPEALAIYGRLMIIAPAHRGSKVAGSATVGTERMGRAMGAEFMYVMATLKIPNMQLALERAGYQLLGFTPGYDREMVAQGVVKRVYEAVFAKVLVPDHGLLRPDPKNLTPKTKALFDLLFPA